MIVVLFVDRPFLSSPAGDDHAKLLGNYPNLLAHQGQSRVSPNLGSYDSGRSYFEQVPNMQGSKQTNSPHVQSANGLTWENPQFAPNDSKRLITVMLASIGDFRILIPSFFPILLFTRF